MKITTNRIISAFNYLDADPLASKVVAQLGDYEPLSELYEYQNAKPSELMDMLKDTAQYGADAGVSGFIYYADTMKFATDNYKLIMRQVIELEDETGSPLCKPGEGYRDPEEANADTWIAWFALETVARKFVDHFE